MKAKKGLTANAKHYFKISFKGYGPLTRYKNVFIEKNRLRSIQNPAKI